MARRRTQAALEDGETRRGRGRPRDRRGPRVPHGIQGGRGIPDRARRRGQDVLVGAHRTARRRNARHEMAEPADPGRGRGPRLRLHRRRRPPLREERHGKTPVEEGVRQGVRRRTGGLGLLRFPSGRWRSFDMHAGRTDEYGRGPGQEDGENHLDLFAPQLQSRIAFGRLHCGVGGVSSIRPSARQRDGGNLDQGREHPLVLSPGLPDGECPRGHLLETGSDSHPVGLGRRWRTSTDRGRRGPSEVLRTIYGQIQL
jgi:hypothetical protein